MHPLKTENVPFLLSKKAKKHDAEHGVSKNRIL